MRWLTGLLAQETFLRHLTTSRKFRMTGKNDHVPTLNDTNTPRGEQFVPSSEYEWYHYFHGYCRITPGSVLLSGSNCPDCRRSPGASLSTGPRGTFRMSRAGTWPGCLRSRTAASMSPTSECHSERNRAYMQGLSGINHGVTATNPDIEVKEDVH